MWPPGLLPVAVFGLIWFITTDNARAYAPRASRRSAFVLAYVGFEVVIALITEITSIGHHLTRGTVAGAWALVLVALAVAARTRIAAAWRARRRPPVPRLAVDEWVALAVLGAFAGVLLAQAWLYRPSNADALAYHLARVEHWIQNQSVAHYAVHFLQQLEFAPLGEYNLAHLHLLLGTDRLDGVVQLFAAAVCVLAVTDIVRLLGGDRRTQLWSAVVCATIPSGLLEATSTQNDYFAAAFTTAALLVLLLWWRGARAIVAWLALATTLSLALLTKGTTMPLIAPLALVLAATIVVRAARADGVAATAKRSAIGLGAGGVIAVVLFGPFLARNLALFDSPFGPWSDGLTIDHPTPQAGAANAIRNVAANFEIGDGTDNIDARISRFVLGRLHSAFDRTGVAIDDKRYTVGVLYDPFVDGDYSRNARNEDIGANPWHVALVGVTGGVLVALVALRRRDLRLALLLASGLTLGFVVFVSATPFQKFGVRLTLPLLVAWSPLIAIVLARAHRVVGSVVLAFLVVTSLPQLLDNWTRSMIHPAFPFKSALAPYFPLGTSVADAVSATDMENLTSAVARSGCDHVAIANFITLEYPIWVGLDNEGWVGTIEETDVVNESKKFMTAGFDDCVALRRVEPTFVTPYDGRAHARWGILDAGFTPAAADRARVSADGIESQAPDVRILPGGGWGATTGDGRVLVAADVTMFATIDHSGQFRLRIDGPPASMTVWTRSIDAPTVGAGVTPDADGNVLLQLPAGIVELHVHLDGVDAANGAMTPVRVTIG
jgi:4-amino-4-deoxy-L-arabinose transferase-like glycosyltransferase